jgi:polar amino acid transport system substrate-binding protein
LNGSVLGDAVVEATGVDLEFKYFNQLADSIQALKGGKVSALVSDLPICKLLVAENPGLTILPEQAAKDDYGMIFAKSNPLRDDFSQVIDKLREDGTLKGLEDKWCGANEDAKVLPEQVWDAPNGTLKGATCGTQMPMTYMKNGEPVGYEIELSLLVAKELGYRVEFTEGDFSSVLGAVSSGKADFGVTRVISPAWQQGSESNLRVSKSNIGYPP